ncbi:MAG TPA: hypothetical protein VGF13_16630, partial [Verrucomicrobiae bacterium]
ELERYLNEARATRYAVGGTSYTSPTFGRKAQPGAGATRPSKANGVLRPAYSPENYVYTPAV